jgi:3-oxoacyl-[acyl-carrier-protein] synthase III
MDAACATGLVQIATAAALVQSGQARNVLLTQSHLLLKTFPLLHPAAPGLGDAATAVVVGATGRFPIVQTVGQTHGEFYRAVTWIRGSDDATDTPWWRAGSEFRVGSRDKESAKVLQRDTVTYGANTLRHLVKEAGVDMERVGLLASVEPRGWVPRAMCEVLGLDSRSVYSVYSRRGHLGACGPIANLEGACRERRLENGTLLALYAQGAGFTTMGVLLEMDDCSE